MEKNKVKAGPVHVSTNVELGVAGEVYARPDGWFAVSLVDTDAGERLPEISLVPDLEEARAIANRMAGLESPGGMVSVPVG